ncbi:MAG: hypothetical protein AAF236_08595 [Verrucomicrobiota bacterium]
MNEVSSSELTFSGGPGMLILGLGLLVAGGVCSFLIWRRSEYDRFIGLLELLRLLVILLVSLTLNQPEWRTTTRAEQDAVVAVLRDSSGSMETLDVLPRNDSEGSAQTRDTVASMLASKSLWTSVETETLEVVTMNFGEASSVGRTESEEDSPGETDTPLDEDAATTVETSGQKGTDLSGVLDQALKQHPNLRAAVLISDGDWNTGEDPSLSATRYRLRGIPIFTIPTGSENRLPDLAIDSFDVPTFALVGKPVRIPFAVSSAMPRDVTAILTLRTQQGETLSREVTIPAMGRVEDAWLWTPQSEGDFEVELRFPVADSEFDRDNNNLSAPIAIRREELRVLLVESYPRWEYRYLRNALERDPGVKVDALLFHPSTAALGEGPGYLGAFPAPEQLTEYDVLFLGDVGASSGQLSPAEVGAIRDHVTNQAAGLILMPGFRGNQQTLTDTPLDDLFPVLLDASQPRGWGSAAPGQFELTELGSRSLLTRLADSENDNARLWSSLPGFQWYAGVERARTGSEVLATHSTEANRYGRIPLIVTKTFGTGKILFMGTDGAWRWRKGVEDRYHYRFWGQVARWMAYQRNMASGDTMRLFYSPDRPQTGDTLTLNANVMSIGGEPLREAEVIVQISTPSGAIESLRLEAGGEEQWGLFTGTFRPTEPGPHQLVMSCRENGSTLETVLTIQGSELEQLGQPARFDVLAEIASLSKGEFFPDLQSGPITEKDSIDQVLTRLADLPEPDPIITRLRIWAHPLWAGFLVLLLVAFWIGRKAIGAV